MHIIIAGCGRVGSQLALYLSYEGHDVAIIDNDSASFDRLGSAFNGITLEGAAFDEEVLMEAGIEKAEAYAAVTNYDNTNLMAAEVAINVYRVPRVVARLYNPDKEATFRRMGVDYVCGTTLLASRMRDKLLQLDVVVQYETPRSGLRIAEFMLPSAGRGQSAIRLNVGDAARVLALLRDNQQMNWAVDTLLVRGDRVVMAIGGEGFAGGMGSSGSGARTDHLKIVIGGCGRVGAQLADALSLDGHEVTVIDNDRNSFRRLAKTYSGEAIEGVAFDEETLERAGIREADAYAAITDYDNANLMAAEVAEHIFLVPRVIARLFNPDKEATYQALGMDYLCGTKLLAQAILEKLVKPLVRTRGQCANNTLNIVEFDYPRAWKERTVERLREDPGIRVAWVRRGEETVLAGQDFACRAGDEVTALVSSRALQRLERKLKNLEGR